MTTIVLVTKILSIFTFCRNITHKRKRKLMGEETSYHENSSTGLTQEIGIIEIGSSTPKKSKMKSPLKSVLKWVFDV